ncbi:MCE family protein [Nocardioides cynanchi]|uniref:MCE family protein n=1 Tax=Nocardioides cynanchi TaxID=2558918 RepID=UPI0012458962|nr:MCE family protein [Nocardioides cynanchi]
MRVLTKVVLPLVLFALVVAALVTFLFNGGDQKTLTAEFPRAVSIYSGSDVRVLGVPVGKIDSVTPSGTDVIVTMHYDANVKIPANAKAVIVSPSIVGDRFVQLTPAYTGGQVLATGATLTEQQTAVPLELDQIYSSLDDLTVALGPNGANKKGALTDLLDTTARNFGGQGAKFHRTIQSFSQLSQTLADNKDQLFGSVRELEGFVHTLARNDRTVRGFNSQLANVSHMLKGERGDLAASLHNLSIAMRQVSGFVKDNRAILGKNITGLDQVTQILVKQRAALTETLRDAPLALNNLLLTYNPQAGTLDTRANLGEVINQIQSDPTTFLCGIVDQTDQGGQACDAIKQLLGAGRTGALTSGRGQQPQPSADQSDPTLGGLVGSPR